MNQEKELISICSSSLIYWVTEGEADIYSRLGVNLEWGKAAAQAITKEANCYLKNVFKIILRKTSLQ